MPAPPFDWAEPSHLGRFGIFLQGDPIPCADRDCQRFPYTAQIEEQHPQGSLPLLWEDGATGRRYHDRCAPPVERERYDTPFHYASHAVSLAGMHDNPFGRGKTVPCKGRGTAHGITGAWVVVGIRYGPDPAVAGGYVHTYRLLLWSRDGQQRLL